MKTVCCYVKNKSTKSRHKFKKIYENDMTLLVRVCRSHKVLKFLNTTPCDLSTYNLWCKKKIHR